MKKKPLKSNKKLKVTITLSVRNMDVMSKEDRKEVAEWLKETAKDLVKNGHVYTGEIKFKYIY
jgi:hypothetical protein